MPAPPIALVVMARLPSATDSKTRLADVLSPSQRAELATAFLADKVDQVCDLAGVAPFLAFTPGDAEGEFARAFGDRVGLIAQRGADLGERLANVAAELFARGFPGVVLVGSDSPNLPTACLDEARGALADGADVVLGPAWDGGYYLIAIRTPRPALFANVAWSTASVLAQTVAIAERDGLRVHFLAAFYDVDRGDDVVRLARDLRDAPRGVRGFPHRTAAVVAAHVPLDPSPTRDERWTTIARRPVYQNRWMRADESVVRLPDGSLTLYGVVTTSPCVGVLPWLPGGRVVLVRQFRYVAQRFTLEMPTGGVLPGEALEAAARRELREEAGYAAGALRHLATYHTSKSIVDEVAHLYECDDLVATPSAREPTEEIENVVVGFDEALAMVLRGEIVDGMTVTAVLLAARTRGR